MRQSGIVAAAGVYALDNCVERLADDHRNTKRIGYGIVKLCVEPNLIRKRKLNQ